MRRALTLVIGLGVLAAAAMAGDLETAQAALKAGRVGEAERNFTRWLDLTPGDAGALYSRARCRVMMGREAEAVEDYRAVLRLKPDSLASAHELSELLERTGRTAEASAAYAAWLKLEPGSAEAKAGLRRCPAPAAIELHQPVPATVPATAARSGQAEVVGTRVGVTVDGLGDDGVTVLTQDNADVNADHLLDYTFGSAPTDWLPAGGRWQVFSRFACDPTWSFFGGWSEGVCCIWNKRRFTGDMIVEAYVSFKHGLPFNGKDWTYNPADLCLTLDGDGHTPASGYSFIYSGDHSSKTMIRRGDKVLGSTSEEDYLAPSYSDVKPDTDNFHRRWWRLEAHIQGQHLRFYVDGQKAIDVVDPEPLRGGQVALWTQHNGMMVARVRVAYADEERARRPQVRIASEKPLPGGSLAVAAR